MYYFDVFSIYASKFPGTISPLHVWNFKLLDDKSTAGSALNSLFLAGNKTDSLCTPDYIFLSALNNTS